MSSSTSSSKSHSTFKQALHRERPHAVRFVRDRISRGADATTKMGVLTGRLADRLWDDLELRLGTLQPSGVRDKVTLYRVLNVWVSDREVDLLAEIDRTSLSSRIKTRLRALL